MGLRGPGAKRKNGRPEGVELPPRDWGGRSRHEKVIRFIESLKVTSGSLAGQKFRVRPWQRKIIKAWYASDRRGNRIVRTGLLSVARKNGKTGLCAALALCHLLGPEMERRGQIVVGATDRDQSGLIFEELEAFIQDNPSFEAECNIKRHEKVIEHLPSGSKFRALSSDAKKAHGLSPSVVILDELAQWGTGLGRNLYDALITASGARKAPLTLIIGTQSADEHNLMSELVDYGKLGTDPTFSAFVYEIPKDADVFDEKTWPLANPALNDFRSLADMQSLAERAKRIPTLQSTFRNLFCNQRIDADERWIPADEWAACARETPIEDIDLLGAGPCYGGLDLGSTQDLTAFALFWPAVGYLKVWAWCPAENLAKREEMDTVPYRVWAADRFIEPTPGRATNKRIVAKRVGELYRKYAPKCVAFDMWGMAEFERILSEENIEMLLKPWGQGYKSMSPATKAFEERVLNRQLVHDGNPLLSWAINNVLMERDEAGNQKPAKQRSKERIDPAVASIMAVGLAASMETPKPSSFQLIFVG